MLRYHHNGTEDAFVPTGDELSEIVRALTDRESELRNACAAVRKTIEEMPAGQKRDEYAAAHERIIASFLKSADLCAALAEKFDS